MVRAGYIYIYMCVCVTVLAAAVWLFACLLAGSLARLVVYWFVCLFVCLFVIECFKASRNRYYCMVFDVAIVLESSREKIRMKTSLPCLQFLRRNM